MELKIKDPGSALTHFIAMLTAMVAATPLLIKAASVPGTMHLKALSVFIVSMILLYAASTVYHTFDISEHVNKILRKIDHMMIFILIAGTYTPVCLIVLGNKSGYRMLSLVWGIAIVGIIINALWINCPKWFSSVIYIAMGWAALIAIWPLSHALPMQGLCWLFGGGIVYTIGGVFYALKIPRISWKYFGFHELFHIFILLGSACFYILIWNYVL